MKRRQAAGRRLPALPGIKEERKREYMKENNYDNPGFFSQYRRFPRSVEGLSAAGEWHALQKLFPDFSGKRVLDLGCGSGILSIAALKLGAASAAAVDIDDKCRDVAYENAALNGIGQDTYTVRIGDVLGDAVLRADLGGGWQMVVANIVADVIIGLSPLVRPMLAPGGLFLCSGIIDDRAQEVADRLRENGWEILETRSAEGWFSYLCR